MTIRLIKADHSALVVLPASQVGPDTVIETAPFASAIIIYADGENLPELLKVVYEQRRLDEQERAKRQASSRGPSYR